MLNCYCQLSSSVIFRQYGVSQSECKVDRPRPGLPRLSPRPHTEALGTRLSESMSVRRMPRFFGNYRQLEHSTTLCFYSILILILFILYCDRMILRISYCLIRAY